MASENVSWWELPGAAGENRTKEQYDAKIAALKEANPNRIAVAAALADEFEKSVGLYRKMPDGQMVEIHVKKVALIQAALRHYDAP